MTACEVIRKKRNILSPSTSFVKIVEILERFFMEHPEEDHTPKAEEKGDGKPGKKIRKTKGKDK